MANMTPQYKLWGNIVVLSEALEAYHFITFPATIPIRKSGIYSALMLGGYVGSALFPMAVLALQIYSMILGVFSNLNNCMIL